MHIDSIQRTRIRRVACQLAALALAAQMLVSCAEKKTKPPEEKVPVSVAVAEQRSIQLTTKVIGTVLPISTVDVKALASGQLTSVNFREGQDVTKGMLLFTIDPRPYQSSLSQAEANLARDMAQMKNAESEATRYAGLVKKDYVTKEDYDRFTSAAEAARAVVAADHAAIENARLQLSYCQIHAPVDGRTGTLNVHTGNLIKAADTTPMVTINQVTPIYVQFSIPERELNALRKRSDLHQVPVTVIPQNGGAPITDGALSFVDNNIDTTTGTITLKALFPNRQRNLWPGQFVNVAMALESHASAVVVPSQAVQMGQKGSFVYVVKDGDAVEMRPVTIETTIDQDSIVSKGVAAGETVVTDGHLRLTPKSKVEVKKASS